MQVVRSHGIAKCHCKTREILAWIRVRIVAGWCSLYAFSVAVVHVLGNDRNVYTRHKTHMTTRGSIGAHTRFFWCDLRSNEKANLFQSRHVFCVENAITVVLYGLSSAACPLVEYSSNVRITRITQGKYASGCLHDQVPKMSDGLQVVQFFGTCSSLRAFSLMLIRIKLQMSCPSVFSTLYWMPVSFLVTKSCF